jgi:hypothetical protein
MHNCKATRELLIESALDGARADYDSALSAELAQCPDCREEFSALHSVSRATSQTLEFLQPSEEFWSGYHVRLRLALDRERVSRESSVETTRRPRASIWAAFFAASFRLPVPVAVALVILFGLAIVVARRSPTQTIVEPQTITKTVEVKVPEERVVTRVVYRDRERRRPLNTIAQTDRSQKNLVRPGEEGATPFSLVGFKPTSDANLTIIKGGNRNEK